MVMERNPAKTRNKRERQRRREALVVAGIDPDKATSCKVVGVIPEGALEMLSELVINRRMMVGNLNQPMASQLVRGDKCSEGRPTGLPPKGLWCMFAVPQAPHQEGSIRNPRAVRLDNPNTLLMSKKITQLRVGMTEVQKAGTPRPDTGYPHECFEGVVFFDR